MAKTFIFSHKNSSITVTVSADTEDEARQDLQNWGCTEVFVDHLRLVDEEEEEDEDDE